VVVLTIVESTLVVGTEIDGVIVVVVVTISVSMEIWVCVMVVVIVGTLLADVEPSTV
jgi:hypothetical protein